MLLRTARYDFIMKRSFLLGRWLAVFLGFAAMMQASRDKGMLAENAKTALISALHEEKNWIKVHAAEALIVEGHSEPVRALIAAGPAEGGDFPRIGLLRIRATLAADEAERLELIRKVEAVFLDPAQPPDRMQALETLCKLGHRISGDCLVAVRNMAAGDSEKNRALAQWALVLAGEPSAPAVLTSYLTSKDNIARLRAAYALRWLKTTDEPTLKQLAAAADAEPVGTGARPYLIASAFSLKADPKRMMAWQTQLELIVDNNDGATRYEACQALMQAYQPRDLGRLIPYFEATGDSRIGPAWAVLHVLQAKK